jgi:hypothetical protein
VSYFFLTNEVKQKHKIIENIRGFVSDLVERSKCETRFNI